MPRPSIPHRVLRHAASTTLLAALASLPLCAQGFVTAESIPVGTRPHELVTGDLEGDGDDDIVVSNQNSNDITILLGDGAGGFESSTIEPGADPQELALSDIDGDGHLDLVSLDGSPGEVLVQFGDGAGGFSAPVASATGVQVFVTGLVLGDFDEDGEQDVIIARLSGCELLLMLGDGTGSFGPPQAVPFVSSQCGTASPPSLRDPLTADFDGDGHLDLAVASRVGIAFVGAWVTVMYGDGTGAFSINTIHLTGLGTAPFGLDTGDLDGDGRPDLVTANDSGDVTVLMNDGVGGFLFGVRHIAGSGDNTDIDLVDVDGDGLIDVVTSARGTDGATILLGDGAGGFTERIHLLAPAWAEAITSGDFGGTGALDLAVAGSRSDDVSILRADADGEWHAARAHRIKLVPVAAPWGLALGDATGDGVPDVLTTTWSTGTLSILTGTGTVHPEDPYEVVFGGPFESLRLTEIAMADVDEDGHIDVLTPEILDDELFVLVGDGAGQFTEAARIPIGNDAFDLAAGWLDGDEHVDVVVTAQDDDNVSVLLGDGNAGFSAATHAVGGSPESIDLGDLDLDGELDIVTANVLTHDLSVLLGDGLGSFAPALSVSVADTAVNLHPSDVVIADLDADGIPDLAATKAPAHDLDLFFGLGDGSFAPPVTLAAEFQPSAVVAVDVDGQGSLDLLVTNKDITGSVSVFVGDGSGSFAAGHLVRVAEQPTLLQTGDLDGDGRPEIVTSGTTILVSIVRNASPLPGDVWLDLGSAKPGSAGEPLLIGTGTLVSDDLPGNDPCALLLSSAAPSTTATLVVGFAALDAPFKGGTLVPAPALLLPVATDASGAMTLNFEIPAGVVGGEVLFQIWIADPGAGQGLSASNGLRGTVSAAP